MNSETNRIRLAGRVEEDAVYSHSMFGEKFYNVKLAVKRRSGNTDTLNITLSDRLTADMPRAGEDISVSGQIRTYNEVSDEGNRLKIIVFCQRAPEPASFHVNEVYLKGYLCRKPYYRITPSGRELCDIMLAVNRYGGKSDYIPCIAWGRNARYMDTLDIGTPVSFSGRLQSRIYTKVNPDGSAITKTAYEVSVMSLELWNSNDCGTNISLQL